MDPMSAIAISATILSVIQSISATSKVISALVKVGKTANDHRYDGLFWRMFSERTSTETLLKRIEFGGRPIPPEHEETFKRLCTQIKDYYEAIEHSLNKIIPKEGKVTLRLYARRFQFEESGFVSLKEQLDSIEAMNRALKILGETLPEYSGSSDLWASNLSNPWPTGHEAPVQHPITAEEDDTHFRIEDTVGKPTRVKLVSLAQGCIEVVKDLASVPSLTKNTSDILARLEMWSAGFLQSELMPLDTLFEINTDKNEVLRQFVIKSLVEIFVAEGEKLVIVITPFNMLCESKTIVILWRLPSTGPDYCTYSDTW
jgi:hypothetical protein